jgi:hypothetical protein
MSKLSRRSLVASAAVLSALAVPAVASTLRDVKLEPDPIFAAIEEHRSALSAALFRRRCGIVAAHFRSRGGVMIEDEEDEDFTRKRAEAEKLVAAELRAILAENPKAKKDQKIFHRLFVEACRSDEKLNRAALLLYSYDLQGEIRRKRAN